MGTKAIEIIKGDVKELIDLLNKALADEWLAVYQYWAGSYVVKGPMRSEIEAELKEHAKEEMEHADMLANRIIELGGEPILNPVDLGKFSNCGYEVPSDPMTKEILKQNIQGEQCAIGVYNSILEKLKGMNDAITYNMIRKIMQDEVKHEQELQDLQEDLDLLCRCKK